MDWGEGDLVSVFVGLAFLAAMLFSKKNRKAERIIYVLANGISLGSLLLIVISPAAQLLGFHENLLELAAREGS